MLPLEPRTSQFVLARLAQSKPFHAAALDAALEDGASALIAAAHCDIARAQGMAKIARKSGLGRESLYKALSAEGNPEFATVMKVIRSLGLKLQVHVG